MELVLPQIQETILDQKAGSYRNVAPTQSWGFETSVLFSSLCTAFWTSGLTPTENVENGGAHTPTASCAPSDLETFMRLLYLTTIVVNFWETVFPQFFFRKQYSHIFRKQYSHNFPFLLLLPG
jgi:hypothetical protein